MNHTCSICEGYFLMIYFLICSAEYINTHIYIYIYLSFIPLPRLYGCLRLACGWILWHVRAVDDGRFRKHICEALFFCYLLQIISVLRAQFTDRHSMINWLAMIVLGTLAAAYGSFRFRRGGNLIKVYELPTSGNLE